MPMTTKAILDNFHPELQKIQQDGDQELVLRWTGEQLAMAGERLKKAKPDERAARGAELLVIAHPHVDALEAVGMAGQALATQAMAILTVLMSKVNPEEMPQLYMRSLEQLCMCAAILTSSLQNDTVVQAVQIAAQCFGLFIATAHSYMPRFGAPDDLRRLYDQLRHQSAQAGESVTHFQGHRIVPQLAADILADTLARLKSMGMLEE